MPLPGQLAVADDGLPALAHARARHREVQPPDHPVQSEPPVTVLARSTSLSRERCPHPTIMTTPLPAKLISNVCSAMGPIHQMARVIGPLAATPGASAFPGAASTSHVGGRVGHRGRHVGRNALQRDRLSGKREGALAHLLGPAYVVEMQVGDEHGVDVGHRDPQPLHVTEEGRGVLLPGVRAPCIQEDPHAVHEDQYKDSRLPGQALAAWIEVDKGEDREVRSQRPIPRGSAVASPAIRGRPASRSRRNAARVLGPVNPLSAQ